ncbi:MAG: hypothetical protein ACPHID_02375 [Thermoplasmatota archaeon]
MRFTILIILVATLAPIALANPLHPIHVAQDTHWTGTIEAPDGLVVHNGTTLTLTDATLEISQRLHVEPGGTLLLAGDTHIRGQQNFSMLIEGTWYTQGGTHIVSGVTGKGLYGILDQTGAIQIVGTAILNQLHVRDSQEGFVVQADGLLQLGNSSIDIDGFAGIGGYGAAYLDHTNIVAGAYALTGKGDCHFEVRHGELTAHSAAIGLNGCDLVLESTTVTSHNMGLQTKGAASVHLRDVTIQDYTRRAIDAQVLPGPGGLADPDRPTLNLHDVRMVPGEMQQPRTRNDGVGMSLIGIGASVFREVVIEGHLSHGVYAETSEFDMQSSRIAGNGGYGIYALKTTFTTDPLANDLGLEDAANEEGPIRAILGFQLSLLDDDDTPLHNASLTVRGPALTVPLEWTDRLAQFTFELDGYYADEDGQWHAATPYAFELRHDTLEQPVEGEILASGSASFRLPPATQSPWGAIVGSTIIGAAAFLFAYAFVGDPVTAWIKQRLRR